MMDHSKIDAKLREIMDLINTWSSEATDADIDLSHAITVWFIDRRSRDPQRMAR